MHAALDLGDHYPSPPVSAGQATSARVGGRGRHLSLGPRASPAKHDMLSTMSTCEASREGPRGESSLGPSTPVATAAAAAEGAVSGAADCRRLLSGEASAWVAEACERILAGAWREWEQLANSDFVCSIDVRRHDGDPLAAQARENDRVVTRPGPEEGEVEMEGEEVYQDESTEEEEGCESSAGGGQCEVDWEVLIYTCLHSCMHACMHAIQHILK